MRVRFVVPTSRSVAPDFAMTSGMRKDPPISTSSPRETITSPPSARVFRASSTAAALLLTTYGRDRCAAIRQPGHSFAPAVCETADRRGRRVCRARRYRDRIRDWNSRAAISAICCSAELLASGARPRLVCRITPVALMTGRKRMAKDCASLLFNGMRQVPAVRREQSHPAARS